MANDGAGDREAGGRDRDRDPKTSTDPGRPKADGTDAAIRDIAERSGGTSGTYASSVANCSRARRSCGTARARGSTASGSRPICDIGGSGWDS